MRVVAFACQLVLCAACAHDAVPRPARVHVPADTVTVNTTLVEAIDAHVSDATGRALPDSVLRFRGDRDSVALVGERGGLQCRSDGVVHVAATAGAEHAELTVRCEIVARLAMDMVACVHEGDRPFPLHLAAYGTDNRVIPAPRLLLTNEDTTVARLRDGMIVPLQKGKTWIEFTTGRRSASLIVVVRDSMGEPRHMWCE